MRSTWRAKLSKPRSSLLGSKQRGGGQCSFSLTNGTPAEVTYNEAPLIAIRNRLKVRTPQENSFIMSLRAVVDMSRLYSGKRCLAIDARPCEEGI